MTSYANVKATLAAVLPLVVLVLFAAPLADARSKEPQKGQTGPLTAVTAGARGADGVTDLGQRGAYVPGELLVRFTDVASAQERAAVRREHEATITSSLPVRGLQLIRLSPGTSVRSAQAAFEREGEVLYAEPNFYYRLASTMPNDFRFGELWGLDNTGQTVNGTAGTPDADIDAPEAWDTTTGDSAVTVAVVDSGVAYDHPDLAPNIWTNPGESGAGRESNGVDDDGNGLTDDWRGWDFYDGDNDPRDFNVRGHGTHVAGTIGARGNDAQGVAGANWQVGLMPLRVCGPSSCTSAGIAAAFAYAGASGAEVVNASLGGPNFSQAVSDAIAGAPDTLYVVAAGNAGTDNDAIPVYPCNYTAANLICVAATDQNDALASFSNYGATSVDLGAPGTDILSAQPAYGSVFRDGFESDDPWTTGGTNDTWTRHSEAAKTGSYGLTDSPGGDYLDDTDSFARNTSPFSLSGETGCRLDYQLRLATQRDFDTLFVEASPDATTWTELGGWTGSTGGSFAGFTGDLSAFDGQASVYIRYRLLSDSSETADGAYVDDVAVRCLTSTYAGDELAFLNGTSMATPHVAGVAALVWAQAPAASVANVKSALLNGVDAKPALDGETVTGGRLNARTAVALAPASPPGPGPGATPPPGPGPGPGAIPPAAVCKVPKLKKKTLKAAAAALKKANCRLGKVQKKRSKKVRKGRVTSQKPNAGTKLREGSKVSVVVSRGR